MYTSLPSFNSQFPAVYILHLRTPLANKYLTCHLLFLLSTLGDQRMALFHVITAKLSWQDNNKSKFKIKKKEPGNRIVRKWRSHKWAFACHAILRQLRYTILFAIPKFLGEEQTDSEWTNNVDAHSAATSSLGGRWLRTAPKSLRRFTILDLIMLLLMIFDQRRVN